MRTIIPGYVRLYQAGKLEKRVNALKEKLKNCTVCPHRCRVDRLNNEKGFCRAGRNPAIASYGPHYGEEPVLVGTGGSGTIFFSFCTLKCVFCQNCEISQGGEGYELTASGLARIMLSLQRKGCHNINLVSPTHFVPQIVEALALAVREGLSIPLVYNTGGYDATDTLELLEGIVDIYMPDIKFGDNEKARKYTRADRYCDIARAAVKEMYRQVGNLETEKGIARKGMLIRHLVMPGNLADTDRVLEFIAKEISRDAFVNLMDQYYPAHKSYLFPELSRRISRSEYMEAVRCARELGLKVQ